MQKAKLEHLIEGNYNLKVLRVVDGPRQFVAETFIIEVENNNKFFVKVIKISKYTQRTPVNLHIIHALREVGFTNLSYPIETKNNSLYIMDNDEYCIVFNYIDGSQTFDYSLIDFANLIASLHKKTEFIHVPVEKEIFNPLYLKDFPQSLENALSLASNTDITLALTELLHPLSEEIKRDWEEFFDLIALCKENSSDFVITHGDVAGNILKDTANKLYLVDWDEVMLAPAERDTWFLAKRKEFIKTYCDNFPNYTVNKTFYKYYLMNRYWEDMLGFIEEILTNKSEVHKRKNLIDLEKDCFNWLRPLIRELD